MRGTIRRTIGITTLALLALFGTATVASAATLSVESGAGIGGAVGGTFAMRTTYVGDTQQAYVQDDSPSAETSYTATFHIRNTLTMTDGQTHQIFRARTPGTTVIRAQIKKAANGSGNFVFFVWAARDGGGFTRPLLTFANNVHQLTVEWSASTGPGNDDGTLRLYKGGNIRDQITNIDNDTHVIDFVQLGAVAAVDASTTGTLDFDNFVSTRTPQFTP